MMQEAVLRTLAADNRLRLRHSTILTMDVTYCTPAKGEFHIAVSSHANHEFGESAASGSNKEHSHNKPHNVSYYVTISSRPTSRDSNKHHKKGKKNATKTFCHAVVMVHVE